MLDRTVISLGTSVAYAARLERLRRSLRHRGFGGEVDTWLPPRYPAGCPPHREAPFAFKAYCFDEARRAGRSLVLWMDSSLVAVKPVDGLFEAIEREGYVLFAHQARVGSWAADLTLERMGLTREDAMAIPEVNAAAIGLHLGHERGLAFLESWIGAARDPALMRGQEGPITNSREYRAIKWNFDGYLSDDPRVLGHRHDQTTASIVAHRLGMTAGEGLQALPRRTEAATVLVNDRGGRRLNAKGRLTLAGWRERLIGGTRLVDREKARRRRSISKTNRGSMMQGPKN